MAKDGNQLNLTVIALVALVAIVSLVALVMNAGRIRAVPISTGGELVSAQEGNVAGEAKIRVPRCTVSGSAYEGQTFSSKGHTVAIIDVNPQGAWVGTKYSPTVTMAVDGGETRTHMLPGELHYFNEQSTTVTVRRISSVPHVETGELEYLVSFCLNEIVTI